jgi:DNA-binding CsgD family transcriptional regulator
LRTVASPDYDSAAMAAAGDHFGPGRARGDAIRHRNQEIARLYAEEGISPEDLAGRFSLKPSTVADILKLRGVALRRRPRMRPPSPFGQRNAEMARLYVDEGLSLRQVGARFGLSYERVRRILMTAGVSRSRPGARLGPR